jgi:hypothetical protein
LKLYLEHADLPPFILKGKIYCPTCIKLLNINLYLILPMKYGAISVKYISYFLKINMKYKYESGRSQNSYLFYGTSFAVLFEKTDKYKTTFS